MAEKIFRLSIVAVIGVYLLFYIGIMVDGVLIGRNVLFFHHTYACRIEDTIDITYGTMNADESITHDGITFPRNQYAFFEFTDYLDVRNRIRACPCHIDRSACSESFCLAEYVPTPTPTFHIRDERNRWREFNVSDFANNRCPLVYNPYIRGGLLKVNREISSTIKSIDTF